MDTITKIIQLLEQNKKMQKDLIEYLGIEKSVFSAWKNGKSKSYSKYIVQIAQFFNVSVDYLIGDSIKFDFDIKSSSDYLICPICSSENVHYVKNIAVDFDNEKSNGIALQFFCEEGHSFYQVFESYKGYTYTAFTDNLTVLEKANTKGIYYESAPYNLADAIKSENLIEKYSVLDEHGKEAVDSILSIEYKRFVNYQPVDDDNLIDLLFYSDTKVSAGNGLYDIGNEYPTIKRVPNNAFTRQANFCCYVSGDSMEPEFYDGDLICVKEQPSVEVGEIGVFVINSELFVKKLGVNGLISLNPKYDIIKKSPDIICQGKVLGKIE